MYLTVAGIIISILGLIWTIYGVLSSNRLKKALLTEKDFIRDKVLDIRANIEKHRQIIINERRDRNLSSLNFTQFRIEDIESILDTLDRFKQRLDKIK
ncbi:MAG: hypothetical protein WA666_08940 [Nitrospirota bacterium]